MTADTITRLESEERDAKRAFLESLKGTDRQAIADTSSAFLEAGRRTQSAKPPATSVWETK